MNAVPDKVVFTELVDILRPKRKVPKSDYINAGALPIIDQGDGLIGGYTDDPEDRFPSTGPVVVFGDHTCRFKYVPFQFAAGADGTQVFRGRKGIDTRYLYYACQTLGLEHYGYQRHMKHLKAAHVPTWPLAIQKKIVSILSAYDDLIENNTRRIAILEEMGRRLYEEWFVYFRFPGYDEVSFKKTDLGRIPAGWKIKSLGDLLAHHIGGGWGKAEQSEEFPVLAYVIRGTDIPAIRHTSLGRSPLRYHKESNFRTRYLIPGDIVFEVSGGSKDQPVGRSVLINAPLLASTDQPVICASFCRLARVDQKVVAPEIVQFHFERIYANRHIMRYQTQSTGITNFKFKVFMEQEQIIVPSADIQGRFLENVRKTQGLAANLGLMNSNLRAQRDLLLPKLISGEIDVSDMPLPYEASPNTA